MPRTQDVVAGVGLGVLVGLLLGLSSTSVAGIVVTALTAGLAAFLGLVRSEGPDRTLRIGAFGLACAVGVVGGVALRAGNWLAPTVANDMRHWTQAGFTMEEAKPLVAFQRLGIQPAGATIAARPIMASSALFGSETALCSRLQRLTDTAALDMLRHAEERFGRALAATVDAAAGSDRPAVLRAARDALCG